MSSGNPKSGRKILRALSPKDYASTAPTTTECQKIDTKGFRWAQFVIVSGALTGSSIACVVSDSNDNFVGDPAVAVTGATFTTLASANDDVIHSVVIDLTKCKRYLQLTFTTTMTVGNMAAICILSHAADSAYIGTGGVDASVDALVV